MRQIMRINLLGGLIVLLLAGASLADEPTDALRAKLRALQAKQAGMEEAWKKRKQELEAANEAKRKTIKSELAAVRQKLDEIKKARQIELKERKPSRDRLNALKEQEKPLDSRLAALLHEETELSLHGQRVSSEEWAKVSQELLAVKREIEQVHRPLSKAETWKRVQELQKELATCRRSSPPATGLAQDPCEDIEQDLRREEGYLSTESVDTVPPWLK